MAKCPDDKAINRMKDWMGTDHSSFNKGDYARDLGLGSGALDHVKDQHFARSSRPQEHKDMISAAQQAEADAKQDKPKKDKKKKPFDKMAVLASQDGCAIPKTVCLCNVVINA